MFAGVEVGDVYDFLYVLDLLLALVHVPLYLRLVLYVTGLC